MTQIDCFSAQKKELLEGCTVLSAFRTADGEIFIECEKRVAFVARRVADSLEKCGEFTPLLIAAAVDAARSFFSQKLDVVADPDSLRLIADCSLDMLTAASSIDMPSAIRLTPDLDFPPDFSDIALGLTMGCEAYGVVERKSVLSAAYTFVPTSYLGDPLDGIEIGVETIENKRGRGYATAAVRALAADLTGRGFRVLFSYYTDNEPSRRIADAIGFCCHAVGFDFVLNVRFTHVL